MTEIDLSLRVAVVGCGALGSFYGAKLCRAGCHTHFLLRSDFDVVNRNGVIVQSMEGDFSVKPIPAQTAEEIGEVDLVLIGLKTTGNHRLVQLLPPLVGANTMVLTLQNGLGNEEILAKISGPENILGGLCFVCLNRIQPGVIQHLAHGNVVLGEFQRPPQPRTEALAALFGQAGIQCQLTANLAQAHWEKLVWNIPFNGLGVAGCAGYECVAQGRFMPGQAIGPCLTTDVLLSEPQWEAEVRRLMLEVIETARALGFPVAFELAERMMEKTRSMGAYKASTLLDYESRRPLELESMFLEPLRQAQRAGVAAPKLKALCRVLEQLNPA